MTNPDMRDPGRISADMPAPADTDPIILRYVGAGYYSVGGLPARDLRQSDFVATHWTPETAAAIGGPVYEVVGQDKRKESARPADGPAHQEK